MYNYGNRGKKENYSGSNLYIVRQWQHSSIKKQAKKKNKTKNTPRTVTKDTSSGWNVMDGRLASLLHLFAVTFTAERTLKNRRIPCQPFVKEMRACCINVPSAKPGASQVTLLRTYTPRPLETWQEWISAGRLTVSHICYKSTEFSEIKSNIKQHF